LNLSILLDRSSKYDILSALFVFQHLNVHWRTIPSRLQIKMLSVIAKFCDADKPIFLSSIQLLRSCNAFDSMPNGTLVSLNTAISRIRALTVDETYQIVDAMASWLDKQSVLRLTTQFLYDENIVQLTAFHVEALLQIMETSALKEVLTELKASDKVFIQKGFVAAICQVSSHFVLSNNFVVLSSTIMYMSCDIDIA